MERTVGLFYRVLLVLSVYLLLRGAGRVRATVGSAVVAVLSVMVFGYVALAWIGGLAFAVLGLALLLNAAPGSRVASAFAGLCFGTAIGIRPDLLVALGLGAGFLVWQATPITRRCVATGALVGLIPSLVNLVRAGPSRVFRGEVIQPIFVFSSGRRLPIASGSRDELIAFLAGLTIICLVAVALSLKSGGNDASTSAARLPLTVALFSIGLVPYYLSRADTVHLLAAFLVPLSGAALLIFPRQLPERSLQTLASLVACLVAVSLLTVLGQSYRDEVHASAAGNEPLTVSNEGRSIPVWDPAEASALGNLFRHVDDIAMKHGSRTIFVGPADLSRAPYNDTYFYYMLPRLVPSSFYLEMEPGVANEGTRLADDLRRTDLVVTSAQYLFWTEPNDAERSLSQAANVVLRSDFQAVWNIGPWRVYVRRRTGPA